MTERQIKSLHMSPELERVFRGFCADMDRIHAIFTKKAAIEG